MAFPLTREHPRSYQRLLVVVSSQLCPIVLANWQLISCMRGILHNGYTGLHFAGPKKYINPSGSSFPIRVLAALPESPSDDDSQHDKGHMTSEVPLSPCLC